MCACGQCRRCPLLSHSCECTHTHIHGYIHTYAYTYLFKNNCLLFLFSIHLFMWFVCRLLQIRRQQIDKGRLEDATRSYKCGDSQSAGSAAAAAIDAPATVAAAADGPGLCLCAQSQLLPTRWVAKPKTAEIDIRKGTSAGLMHMHADNWLHVDWICMSHGGTGQGPHAAKKHAPWHSFSRNEQNSPLTLCSIVEVVMLGYATSFICLCLRLGKIVFGQVIA